MTDTPIARATDPHTSHLAGDALTASGKRAAQTDTAAWAVARHPNLTAAELARATSLDRYMLSRRLPDAERKGLVKRGPERPCRISGREAVTWIPA